MTDLSLILFDDETARGWEPFALTRPAGELLFGALLLRARAERVLGARAALHLAADHLLGFEEAGAPPVAPLDATPADGDRLFWLSRAVPAWGDDVPRALAERRPGPLAIDGSVVGWYAPEGTPAPPRAFLDHPEGGAPGLDAAPPIDVPGRVLRHVWDLVSCAADQITADVEALHPGAGAPELGPGVHHWGSHPLVIGKDVRIEPGAVFDTDDGPIWLDDGSTVRAFTRLCGPAYVGPGSVLLGGTMECIALGPVCKVRGELSTSTCLGYTNKQHDGHMGHAYLGRWVNLGAETTNSDLKNNYGTIRMWTPAGEVDTGEIKLGSLLGDHVKTGIGLLLNTGTVVGAGSNLFGAAMPPRYVPPFSWGSGAELVEYRADKFLEVAEVAMGRRNVPLTEGLREQLRRAWVRGRGAVEPGDPPKG